MTGESFQWISDCLCAGRISVAKSGNQHILRKYPFPIAMFPRERRLYAKPSRKNKIFICHANGLPIDENQETFSSSPYRNINSREYFDVATKMYVERLL
jgi:hypothetical protein